MSPAFEGARQRGRRAFAAGAGLDANPYAGESRTYSRAFWRAWRQGWREAQMEGSNRGGQLNLREAMTA